MKLIIQIISIIFFIITINPIINSQVLDDIVERKILKERKVLAYPPLRESDIFWEKKIWRVLDFREKMNQGFMYPDAPFFEMIKNAAMQGIITLFGTEDDKFTYPMTTADLNGILFSTDTVEVFNPETLIPELVVTTTELDWQDVKRMRIKEQWFFDENTSTLQVRIIGIAPLIEVRGETGNFRYEKPLFWAYYPELRPVLARREVFNGQNEAALMSWEDLFEMRFFSSYIFKQSNVQDDRLQSIYTGVDLLLEADKIKQEIFNFEHDLWSY